MQQQTKDKIKRGAKLTAKILFGAFGGLLGVALVPLTFIPDFIGSLFWRVFTPTEDGKHRSVPYHIGAAFLAALTNVPVWFYKDSYKSIYHDVHWHQNPAAASPPPIVTQGGYLHPPITQNLVLDSLRAIKRQGTPVAA